MAETKYGKYIITRPKDKVIQTRPKTNYSRVSMYVDDEVIKGAYYFMGTWIYQVPGKGTPDKAHAHDFDEYLVFVGSNPEEPYDLCGEIELWLGGEKHIITESCVVFIPRGLIHAPIYFRRVDKPIFYIATGPQDVYHKKDGA
jgi:quercetin dioxygenase-like cupin family protein